MLRIRKRTRGARSPDIDPYSKETRETKRERPRRMLRYLERIWVSQSSCNGPK